MGRCEDMRDKTGLIGVVVCLTLLLAEPALGLNFNHEDINVGLDKDQAVYFFAPGPVMGFYYFEYQKALATRHSVNVAIEYANFKYEGDALMRFWGIYRYKLRMNYRGPLDGVFLTPALQVARSLDGEATILNSLLYLSYQRVSTSGWSVQVFAGAGYGEANRETEKYQMYTGFSPSLGVSLGYTF